MKTSKLRYARKVAQAIFLILFLFLFIQTESKGADELGYPVRLFLEFNPLLFLSVLFSGRTFVLAFLLSLATVSLTVVLGRVFCGWICPLGTLNNAEISEHIYTFLKNTILSFQQPYFQQSFLISYLCPLGALLGVFSRFSVLSRSLSEGCSDRGKCHDFCQGGGLQRGKNEECLQCFNCDDLCPAVPDIAVRKSAGKGSVTLPDLEKRRLFASVAAGIIAAPLMKVGVKSRADQVEPALIRPPVALEENASAAGNA